MKEFIYQAFGEGKDLEWWQMVDRGIVIFLLAITLVRISGRRSFGKGSALDNTVVILLGTTLGRALVGVSPFFPTVMACLALVLLHRIFAWATVTHHGFGRLVKGEKIALYEKGRFNHHNMKRGLVSERDIMEDLRLKVQIDDLEEIESVWLERSGEVSGVKKKKE